jgi:hypothetical protein
MALQEQEDVSRQSFDRARLSSEPKKPAFVDKILDGVEFNLETDASTTAASDKTNAVCKGVTGWRNSASQTVARKLMMLS